MTKTHARGNGVKKIGPLVEPIKNFRWVSREWKQEMARSAHGPSEKKVGSREGGSTVCYKVFISTWVKQKHDDESILDWSNKSNNNQEAMKSIPIFLQKSYELIRACDPQIASWDDDDDGRYVI